MLLRPDISIARSGTADVTMDGLSVSFCRWIAEVHTGEAASGCGWFRSPMRFLSEGVPFDTEGLDVAFKSLVSEHVGGSGPESSMTQKIDFSASSKAKLASFMELVMKVPFFGFCFCTCTMAILRVLSPVFMCLRCFRTLAFLFAVSLSGLWYFGAQARLQGTYEIWKTSLAAWMSAFLLIVCHDGRASVAESKENDAMSDKSRALYSERLVNHERRLKALEKRLEEDMDSENLEPGNAGECVEEMKIVSRRAGARGRASTPPPLEARRCVGGRH